MNTFIPNIEEVGTLSPRTIDEIKNEPMLWSSDLGFAEQNGGPLTSEFLRLLDPNKKWIIDTRVHMLMEGWYPCIGGWHCDNIPRNTDNGQPNFKNPPFVSNHTLGIVDVGTDSLTEFLTTPVTLPDVNEDEKAYGVWSPLINEQLEDGNITSTKIESGKVISFDAFTFHRGTPAKGSGWRFFIRAMTDTPLEAKNEIRRQVNTYLSVESGW